MSSDDELISRLVVEVRDLQEAHDLHKQQREYHTRMEMETAENLKHVQATLSFLQSKVNGESRQASHVASKSAETDITPNYGPLDQTDADENVGSFVPEPATTRLPQRSPDDMRKPEYRDVNLINVIGEVAQTIGKPFKVDDAVHLVYDFGNEEERQACRRSLNAGLSRALAEGVIDRYGRGIYVPKQQAVQAMQFTHGEYSQ